MSADSREWRQNAEENARQIEKEIGNLESDHRDGERYKYKEFFAHAKEIVELFKNLKPLLQEDRARLWDSYRSLCDGVAAQRQEWFDSAKANAEQIKDELDSLGGSYGLDFFSETINPSGDDINFKDFWEHAGRISVMFKELKPILREDREKLWQKFNDIRDKVRAAQNNKKEKEKRNSEERKELVIDLITDAENYVGGAEGPEDLNKAKSLLDEAMAKMKTGWNEFNTATYFVATSMGDEGRLTKEDRQECWDKLREVKEKLGYKREDMWQSAYDEVKEEIGKAYNYIEYEQMKEAFAQLRIATQALKDAYLSKEKRQILRDELNDLWEKAKRIADRKRQEYEEKKQEWKNRMDEKIERLEGVIDKQEDYVRRVEDQISDLENRISGSTNDNYIRDAEGWIEEKRDKIRDAERSIEEIKEKIQSIKDKMDD